MAGQNANQVLVSENGTPKLESLNGIQVVRITKSSPAFNYVTDSRYVLSNDIIGTTRPQFGAYDAGAYEIPATALRSADISGVPYIRIGDTVMFSLDIYPENATLNSKDYPPSGIFWRSSSSDIIRAGDTGSITALKAGSSDIWAEVHGWDSQGRDFAVNSKPITVYAGDEAFTELRAEISYIADRSLYTGATQTVRPDIHIVIDRYNLDGADGLGYSLEAVSERPDIVSVDVISGDIVRLKAGYTEGVSVITIHTDAFPDGRTESRKFTATVIREYVEIESQDVESRDARGIGSSGGGCNAGIAGAMILSLMIIWARKES